MFHEACIVQFLRSQRGVDPTVILEAVNGVLFDSIMWLRRSFLFCGRFMNSYSSFGSF